MKIDPNLVLRDVRRRVDDAGGFLNHAQQILVAGLVDAIVGAVNTQLEALAPPVKPAPLVPQAILQEPAAPVGEGSNTSPPVAHAPASTQPRQPRQPGSR